MAFIQTSLFATRVSFSTFQGNLENLQLENISLVQYLDKVIGPGVASISDSFENA